MLQHSLEFYFFTRVRNFETYAILLKQFIDQSIVDSGMFDKTVAEKVKDFLHLQTFCDSNLNNLQRENFS